MLTNPKNRPSWLATDAGKEAMSKLSSNPDNPSSPRESAPKASAPKLVSLKIGDQTYEVQEAVAKGFLRQEDYTRKTQEVAAQRREIQSRKYALDEFEKDPEGWIKRYHPDILAKPGEKTPEGHSRADDGETDPGKIALEKVEDLETRQEIKSEEQRIEGECMFLAGKYPDDFNRTEVLDFAIKNNYSSVIQAFKDLHFDRMERRHQNTFETEVNRRVAEVLASNGRAEVSEPADQATAAIPVPHKAKPKDRAEARSNAVAYLNEQGLHRR